MSELTNIFLSTRKLLRDVVAKIVPASEVEDIVQDTFVKIQSIKEKSTIERPAAYMVQTAKNLAYDYVKSARFRSTSGFDKDVLEYFENISEELVRDTTLQHAASERDFYRFCQEVKKLPEKCQKVYMMKKVYGYSQKEISEKIGISASTVEKHIAYGTKRLFHLMRHSTESNRASRRRYSDIASGREF